MKGRIFAVNEKTRKEAIENKELSVTVPNPKGNQWNRTLQDIASDFFQLDIGDYAFLWEIKTKNIYGVYRIISKPFYKKTNDNQIFKIKIEKAYDFINPIQEYDIVNNPYMKNRLWNIVGKKISGKPRGSTPLTLDEISFLIQSLIDVNQTYTFSEFSNEISIEDELKFDLSKDIEPIPASIKDYIYKPIGITKDSNVHYEKALEGILNIFLRDKRNDKMLQLGIDCNNVIWFANYLPYGLDRTEMDYMIQESQDKSIITKIDVIEIMADIIDKDHINRCCQYAKWVSDALLNGKRIVRPILICGCKSLTSSKGLLNPKIQDALKNYPKKYKTPPIEIYTYKISNNDINFSKYGE